MLFLWIIKKTVSNTAVHLLYWWFNRDSFMSKTLSLGNTPFPEGKWSLFTANNWKTLVNYLISLIKPSVYKGCLSNKWYWKGSSLVSPLKLWFCIDIKKIQMIPSSAFKQFNIIKPSKTVFFIIQCDFFFFFSIAELLAGLTCRLSLTLYSFKLLWSQSDVTC